MYKCFVFGLEIFLLHIHVYKEIHIKFLFKEHYCPKMARMIEVEVKKINSKVEATPKMSI